MAPDCATTPIPDHRHEASLDLFHTEIGADYGLAERLTLSLRVPYDVKAQEITYTTLEGEPYVPSYGDIHHRTETLRGFGDWQAFVLFPLGTVVRSARACRFQSVARSPIRSFSVGRG